VQELSTLLLPTAIDFLILKWLFESLLLKFREEEEGSTHQKEP
jgi:hypothetical protein